MRRDVWPLIRSAALSPHCLGFGCTRLVFYGGIPGNDERRRRRPRRCAAATNGSTPPMHALAFYEHTASIVQRRVVATRPTGRVGPAAVPNRDKYIFWLFFPFVSLTIPYHGNDAAHSEQPHTHTHTHTYTQCIIMLCVCVCVFSTNMPNIIMISLFSCCCCCCAYRRVTTTRIFRRLRPRHMSLNIYETRSHDKMHSQTRVA